jgi:acetyl esterase/lipase
MHDVAIPLAEMGMAAVCPQYRLAPTHRYPAAIDDISACVEFLRRSAGEYRLDANRIATLGNSSGGHLAAMAGLRCNLQGVVDISGVSDLTDPEHDHYEIGAAFVFEFMGTMPSDAPDDYRQASPITHIVSSSPPFLVIHGEADDIVPIDQSVKLVECLRENHVDVEYHTFPGEAHSFTYPAWRQIETMYIAFLKRVLDYENTLDCSSDH